MKNAPVWGVIKERISIELEGSYGDHLGRPLISVCSSARAHAAFFLGGGNEGRGKIFFFTHLKRRDVQVRLATRKKNAYPKIIL